MSMLASNPDACWLDDIPDDIIGCYHSKVENGCWIGPDKCFNSGCLILHKDDAHFKRHPERLSQHIASYPNARW